MLEDQQIYQAHPVLHHHTTEDGLRGILESETLWATHYKHLNDTSEISHMRQSLIQRITPATKNVITEYARKDNEEKQRILDWGGVDTVSLRTTTDIIARISQVNFGVGSFER